MSGAGAPTFTHDREAAAGLRVAIVAAQWHEQITVSYTHLTLPTKA